MITTNSITAPSASTRWLSLKQASTLLGVNANSLRNWADQGVVRSFRTPGGHRRFAESDLVAVTATAKPAAGALPEQTIARIRRKMPDSPVARETWGEFLPAEHRTEFRTLGRRLVELALDYLSTPKARAALNAEGRTIGERYGCLLREDGLTFSQMLEAFLFFRNLIEDGAMQAYQSRPSMNPGATHRTLNGLLDQVLLGTVRGYEAVPVAEQA